MKIKVGDEVWFMDYNEPANGIVQSLGESGWTHIKIKQEESILRVLAFQLAPTKEALRIKVFGE